MSAGLTAASFALTRLPSVRAPPAVRSDENAATAAPIPFAVDRKMNR
jgi:hypothetical protein